MRPKILVIVPCFNESEVLRETAASLVRMGYEVVAVDDGSDPPAAACLGGLPVHLLRHEVNLGQGAALQTGMEYALSLGAEIAVHFDADGQHCPEDIAALVQPILDGEADVVLGSRFLTRADAARVPAARRLVLRLARLVNGMAAGLWLTDAHNGLRALSRRALEEIELQENRMAHATEILQIVRRSKLRWREVPARVFYSPYSRRKGQSALNSLDILFDLILGRLK